LKIGKEQQSGIVKIIQLKKRLRKTQPLLNIKTESDNYPLSILNYQLFYYAFGPTIFSGRTALSNSSSVKNPRATAASLSVVFSACAFLAILAALS